MIVCLSLWAEAFESQTCSEQQLRTKEDHFGDISLKHQKTFSEFVEIWFVHVDGQPPAPQTAYKENPE